MDFMSDDMTTCVLASDDKRPYERILGLMIGRGTAKQIIVGPGDNKAEGFKEFFKNKEENMKNRSLAALVLAAVTAASLTACSSGSSAPATTAAPAAAPAETQAAAADTQAAAPAADGEVYHIQWAHSSSTNDRLALATEKMAKELEEASGGRLIIDHYPASQLGAEREILEGVQLGTIDAAVISCGVVANFSNAIYVTSTPYLIDQREIGWKVYDGEFGQKLGHQTEADAGWKWLGWGENSLRMFSNSKRPIHTPADMVGLKIRTMENDIHMAIVNALGASATPVAFSELYTALQQGTVDGQENGVALTYSMGFNEVVKYMTYLPHIYDPYLVCMSSACFNKLPADLQALMEEYGQKYCQYEREFNLQNDTDYLKEMEEKGLEVYYPTPEETQLFVDATAGVEQLIRDKVGDEFVDAYKAAVEEAKK